ncbi:hypothetical protein KIN20_015059 [Parelaphostrongylus tenuis]|uniref:Uncharacterized protein n=1 Tax=Parelaphostrongylus tenuis TaxID=148309 RepID=A0AAD5MI04_PARTN|nr:hypothetical protein KIN20_015059 [Parelaphostrongylus tenuis]
MPREWCVSRRILHRFFRLRQRHAALAADDTLAVWSFPRATRRPVDGVQNVSVKAKQTERRQPVWCWLHTTSRGLISIAIGKFKCYEDADQIKMSSNSDRSESHNVSVCMSGSRYNNTVNLPNVRKEVFTESALQKQGARPLNPPASLGGTRSLLVRVLFPYPPPGDAPRALATNRAGSLKEGGQQRVRYGDECCSDVMTREWCVSRRILHRVFRLRQQHAELAADDTFAVWSFPRVTRRPVDGVQNEYTGSVLVGANQAVGHIIIATLNPNNMQFPVLIVFEGNHQREFTDAKAAGAASAKIVLAAHNLVSAHQERLRQIQVPEKY